MGVQLSEEQWSKCKDVPREMMLNGIHVSLYENVSENDALEAQFVSSICKYGACSWKMLETFISSGRKSLPIGSQSTTPISYRGISSYLSPGAKRMQESISGTIFSPNPSDIECSSPLFSAQPKKIDRHQSRKSINDEVDKILNSCNMDDNDVRGLELEVRASVLKILKRKNQDRAPNKAVEGFVFPSDECRNGPPEKRQKNSLDNKF
jgi:hypothetical protein